ncbi:MAG: glycoside hydrolase family 88 protein, partial [Chitinophagia bacterium]|nr:glycoside hydrolase family 88 protein [Chitinophagia bacterium]
MKKIIFFFLLGATLPSVQAQTVPPSQQLAATCMRLWKDSFSLDNKPAKWTYDMGVILQGIEQVWLATGDATYFNYIQKQVDYFVSESGTISGYKQGDFNLDNINNGKLLLMLYEVTQKEKYLKAARQLYLQLQQQPRTTRGAFWHKKIYPNQQWL